MNKTKDICITGFALFSMFFGAGNLILPPFLGKNAGDLWSWVTIGFFITAVFIPILGILAHAKLQGTLYDFGKKVSPLFSTVYCLIIYTISIALPAPRTASVTHEMAIAPYFNVNSLITSSIYFGLVFIFVINRSKILNLLGKFLTPLIILILLAIIFIGIFSTPGTMIPSTIKTPFISGLLEGYQTFDAIGAIVVGGILVVSLNFNKKTSFKVKKDLITKAGFIAGLGLLIIYAGLIYNGALFNSVFNNEATRSEVLTTLSTQTLGNIGTTFLSLLVSLACFTTAVGIITGTADYIKGITNNLRETYITTAIIGCVLGVIVGQFDVRDIINIALPVLMFIYPITIVLIILNVIPNKYASALVFKVVVITTFIFSIPDFLEFFIDKNYLTEIKNLIPLANQHLGWVLPAVIVYILTNMLASKKLA
ncbi:MULTISPECIES: branched-chain amino acid transport system II carrier protein [Tenacibaculum]|uniref:branched-chain amino acid transport system II carrier protein n=1 Tax=Tenacibaculum TaxID=104267 RepID=UPI0021AFADD1|nr:MULTISPECIES: branched-chain amino acid transport system II carrier protein [Tenacibaculum]MCT4700136.1 branched-chain amino acid transport system II carrier protein [Tenacibaculum haliotis]WBX71137.1 branched-chain amino acid transport system II carrier protein [Tenacibaculum retecalamus]